MKRFATFLGSVSPVARTATHAADVVAALAPPPPAGTAPPAALTKVDSTPQKSVGKVAMALAPAAAGGAAGAYLWKDHRILGAIAGLGVGQQIMPLVKGEDRKGALCMLAVDGAGVAGALIMKKHPVLGFFGGLAAGAVATSFVDGSPVQKAWKKFRESK